MHNRQLPKCVQNPEITEECLTIGYGIIGKKEPWIEYVMNYTARINNLQKGKDVKEIFTGSPREFYKYHSNDIFNIFPMVLSITRKLNNDSGSILYKRIFNL